MGIFKHCYEAYLEACPCRFDCNMTFRRFTRVGMALFLLITIPLQAAGMFTSNWAETKQCSNFGLVNTKCENLTRSGKDALDSSAFGFQTVSFIIHLATAVVYMCVWCSFYKRFQEKNDEDEIAIAKFCFLCFLPAALFLAGLLNFVSCMIVSNKSLGQDFKLGYSYYLCLITSIFMMIIYAIFIIGYFIKTYAKHCMCRCHFEDPWKTHARATERTAQGITIEKMQHTGNI
ncbi:uncharacterized protein LOC132756254 [Ruditapes philippinarum]|uniref:uncharacterized protein LOC132756254 n=1 Tax=Ruditapes philippinarum TaxID=129788 RepID=UPI00295B4A81|nr:uncharacterized protein LOC132756254 [Ruditapes philippinarum]